MNNSILKLPSGSPIMKCLSNHMLKFSQVKNIYAPEKNSGITKKKKERKETWDSVYNDKYPNHMF